MEANKERREQLEEEEDKDRQKKNEGPEGKKENPGIGPMAKVLIRESIICEGGDPGKNDRGAEDPGDVLAFSRSVHKTDSSLE